jgi:hypothetical protein
MTKTEQIVKKLERDNPQLRHDRNKSHVKLYADGRLVGILPVQLRTEGLAKNTVAQLRRAGLRVAVLCLARSRRRWSRNCAGPATR